MLCARHVLGGIERLCIVPLNASICSPDSECFLVYRAGWVMDGLEPDRLTVLGRDVRLQALPLWDASGLFVFFMLKKNTTRENPTWSNKELFI